jgi:hypothetical protein
MNEPPFSITYTQEPEGLRAHVVGVNGNLLVTLAYWQQLAGEVARRGTTHLLVVDDMDGEPPPPDDLLRFITSMQGGPLQHVRIAYVEAHVEQMPKIEAAELVAREHGFEVKTFSDEAPARVWLRYGERRDKPR